MTDITPSTLPARLERAINLWLVRGGPGSTNETYLAAIRRLNIPDWKIPSLSKDEATLVLQNLYLSYSDNTVQTTVAAASSLWDKLVEDGLAAVNPWKGQHIKKPKDKTAERCLLPWELQALVDAADAHNPRDGAYCRFLYYTCLRVSTSVSVLWRDLRPVEDEDGRIDHFAITAQSKGGKTGTVNLPAWVVLGWYDEDDVPHDGMVQIFGRANIRPDDRVWPFGRVWAYKIVARAGELAGLGKNVSPHWLRHTGATDALKAGANIRTVQESLFHVRLDTTMKYTHVEPEDRIAGYLRKV